MATACCICFKVIQKNKHKAKGAYLCEECYNLCDVFTKSTLKNQSPMEISNHIKKKSNLTITPFKHLEFVRFDFKEKKFAVQHSGSIFAYNFDDIISYEVRENGYTINKPGTAKSGLGRAVAGGLLFGGAGAIVGGITGKKSATQQNCNKMELIIKINNMQNPCVIVDLMPFVVSINSEIYVKTYKIAMETVSKFDVILEQQKTEQFNSNNREQVETIGFIFCNKCGAKLPGESSFCNKCGSKVVLI